MIDVLLRAILAWALSVAPAPEPTPEPVAAPLRGWATHYDAPSKQDAAAGPALRRALGRNWRGSWVRVSHVGGGTVRTVTVILSDWCQCRDRHGQPTLIDLDLDAFNDLAPLSSGIVSVRVEEIEGVPTRLPATDVAP